MPVVDIKKMPLAVKVDKVQDKADAYRSFIINFVRQQLSQEAANDLALQLDEVVETIPQDAPANTKYELYYTNWLQMVAVGTGFIRERLGEEGTQELELADLQALKDENDSPLLYLLKIMRAIAPRQMFKMTVAKLAYELQWMTPYQVTELSERKLCVDVPSCKVVQYAGGEDACYFCQTVYPRWAAEQFRLDMAFDRQGQHCSLSVIPLA